MEVSGQFHAPAALHLGEESQVSIRLEAEWATELVWTRWWWEKFTAPRGTRTPNIHGNV